MFTKRWLCGVFAVCLSVASNGQTIVVVGSGGVEGSHERCVDGLTVRGFTAQGAEECPLDLSGVSVVVALGMEDPGPGLRDWVLGGGLLITNFNSAFWAEGYLDAVSADSYEVGFESVRLTAAGVSRGLGADTLTAVNDPGVPEVFAEFESVGAGQAWAVRDNGAPVIVGGRAGLGEVVLMAYDWADLTARFAPPEAPGGGLGSVGGTALEPGLMLVDSVIRFSPAELVTTTIPEPATFGVVLAAAVALAAVGKRRRERTD